MKKEKQFKEIYQKQHTGNINIYLINYNKHIIIGIENLLYKIMQKLNLNWDYVLKTEEEFIKTKKKPNFGLKNQQFRVIGMLN
jgi:uncharacterized protein YllA (UPF0747 family)